MHPAGEFEAEIVEHGTETAESGTPGVWLKFATEHGFVRGDLWITENTANHIARKLRNCGFAGKSMSELDSDILCGNMVRIKVDHEEFKKKISAKVNNIYPYQQQPANTSILDEALAKKTDSAPVFKRDKPAENEEVPF